MCTYKKWGRLISIVLLLGLAGNTSAAQVWFYGGGDGVGLWNDAAEWYGGVPTSADHANLNEGGAICTIDSTHTGGSAAVCNRLTLPDWQNGTAACVLEMTGGTLTVGSGGNFEMGHNSSPYDIGILNLSGGTITVEGYLHVGQAGEGTINMTGGTINISGAFEVPQSAGSGLGTVNLDGGTIQAGSFGMNANGLLDVGAGTLIINGNVVSTINSYVSNGWITAYNGSGTVNVDYDVTNPGQTTVTGTGGPGPGQATNPSPANGATNVSRTADLSWTAGADATSHDVYFGTTSPGTFQGNQTGTTFDPGTMTYNTTYYWRIDEKNAAGTTTGVVWSFTTTGAPAGPTITVNAGSVEGDISNLLNGVSLAYCFSYDSIYADGTVANYLQDIGVKALRYPGGGKSTYYHWEYPYMPWLVDAWDPSVNPDDYIGNTHHMDTDELAALAATLGAEPVITVNFQSGVKYRTLQDSIDDVVNWLTYCNVTNNYNFKYWSIENEPYYANNGPAVDVYTYADYVNQFATAMKAVDPSIKIIANWNNELSEPSYWDQWVYLIETAGANIDYADLHWYWYWEFGTWAQWLVENPMTVREWCPDCYNDYDPGSYRYEGPPYVDELKHFRNMLSASGIEPVVLEWNLGPVVECEYSKFQSAMLQSEMMAQYIAGGLYLATIWPLDWDGDLLCNFRTVLDQVNHEPTPTYLVFKLYSEALGQQLITSSSTVDSAYVVSALSQDGSTLWVYVVHKTANTVPIQVDIGSFTAETAEAAAMTADGGNVESDTASIGTLGISFNSGTGMWECDLPPYSLTMLTFQTGAPPPLPGQASNPSPADGATDVSINADLSWTAGSDATSHDVYFGTTSPGTFQGNQTGVTFDPGTMNSDTTYYWRIDEKNTAGTTTGVVWSFTTETALPPPLPGQATNPSPADGATNVSVNADLSWTAGSDATSHDVYFGTTSPGTFQGNQTATSFDPGTLAYETTYYWRIDEKNAAGTTTGVVWSFTTQIAASQLISLNQPAYSSSDQNPSYPPGNAVDGDLGTRWSSKYSDPQWIYVDLGQTANIDRVVLNWEAAYGQAYEIQVSDNASDWTAIYSTTTGDGGIDDLSISGTGRYVRMYGTQRGTSWGYSLWEFEIYGIFGPQPPGQATNPSPADGGTDVSTIATLSWTAGSGATSHDVYFGTTSPGAFQGNQTATTFDPGTLANSTTYYWRIDEVNANGTTTGTVWSFTTEAAPPPLPGQATNPSPADGATGVSTTADLSWTAGSDATSHDVYFGTTSPGTFQGNQTGTTFDPGTMASNTTYYWRIDEKNATGTTTGVVWSFTTTEAAPPGQASNPGPADGATDVGTTAGLSWTAGSGADSHDVYFGTDSTPDSTEFQGNQTGTTFDPGTLAHSTIYYWRIDEKNAAGTTTGVVWSFTTVAGAAGQQVWFFAAGTTGRWDTSADWTPSIPSSVDTANINKVGKTCIIDSANTGANAALCATLWLPDWEEGGPGDCILSISGGSLTVAGNVEMGRYGGEGTDPYDAGVINISGGTVNIGGQLSVGYLRSDRTIGGSGTINMTGGSIDVTGALLVPMSGATGTVNLDAGTIEAGSITMDLSGSLDIEAGTLIIDGDVVSTINSYVSNGWLTAYNGSGTVNVDYDVTNPGQTTVTGTMEAPPLPGQATNPSPADGATNVSTIVDLSWTAGSDATSHDVYFGTTSPGTFQGNQPGTTFDPGTMNNDTTYYWRIDEKNVTGTTTGVVWSFTTETAPPPLPGQATNPSPADGATDVSINANLSWTAGSDATSHDVYFGTTSPGTFQGNQTGTTFDPGTMANNTTYYWRIDEKNAAGTTTGVVWSFTTEAVLPGQATNPSPADGATNVSTTADLSWTADSDATSHDVYFGTTSPGTFQGNQPGTTFDPGVMTSNTTYYWRIDEKNAAGTTTGVVWSFTTTEAAPPGQASNPSPADGAIDVSTTTDLSWTAGSGATSHDVYFGTDSTPDNTEFQGNQTGTTFDPGTLAHSTTYYWRIDEKNAAGTTTGVVWSFTTVAGAAGQQVWFYGGGQSSGTWNTAGNWWGGVPTSVDHANLNEGGITCIVDSSHSGTSAALCNRLTLPDWQNGTAACVLEMTGGTLTVGSGGNFEMGRNSSPYDIGVLNLIDGTISVGGYLHVGQAGEGTINMTGGSIDISGAFEVPQSAGSGLGTVYLDAGTIEAGSISMNANGSLDIDAGTLIIDGDVVSTINSYVSNGWLTAYNGTGNVNVDYDVTNPGQTTVTGTMGEPPPLPGQATNPSPADGATNVNITATLSWTAGSDATSHDVYFGTTSPGTFRGNQTGTTYDPGTMNSNTTYYWRIDEKNVTGTTTGVVWSFTTTETPLTWIDMRKGPYMVYRGNSTEMTVNWQLDSTLPCTLKWGTDTTYSSGSVNTTEFGSDHQHAHTITGLAADTMYYYQVVVDATYYDSGSFRTPPTGSALKFIAYGDTRTNAWDHDNVDREIVAAINADSGYQTLLIMTGDMVNEGDTEDDWTWQFFHPDTTNTHELHTKMPVNSCRGNHERSGAVWSKYFWYPYVGNYYWSTDYGPAHFAFVDQYIDYSPGSTQYNWLENDLASTNKEWVFIVLHAPGYSADGYHDDSWDVQNYIQPLCETYNVDIVFAGHNHNYSRCTVNGVTHLTTGGGGAPQVTPDPYYNPYIDACERALHFCKIAINGTQLDGTIVRADGSWIETFTLWH